jgi:mannosyltransferase
MSQNDTAQWVGSIKLAAVTSVGALCLVGRASFFRGSLRSSGWGLAARAVLLPVKNLIIKRPRQDLALAVTLFVLLVATALRFAALGRQSLWADELFSVYWARAGVDFVLAHIRDETNPPLYYFLLEIWMRIFGDSEAAVRLLSAILSAITVPVVYLLGRELFGKQAGRIAALLYALSYWHLYYAQEARSYALLDLSFALALKCLLSIVANLRRGARPLRVAFSGPGLGFSLAAVVLGYTHFIGIVILATLGVTITLIWWRPFAFDRRFLTCFAIVAASVSLPLAPIVLMAAGEGHSANLTWLVQPSLRGLIVLALGTPDQSGWFRVFSQLTSLLLWTPLLVYGARKNREWLPRFLVYLFPAIGFGMLVFVGYCYTPVLLNRTAAWISIPIYLGLAGAVSSVKLATAKRAIVGMILASSMVSAGDYFFYIRKEPWRSLISEIEEKVSDRDLVVFGSDTPATAALYYGKQGVLPLLRRWPTPTNITAADILDEHETNIRPISSDDITTAVNASRRIIFISKKCALPIGFGSCPGEPCTVGVAVVIFRRGKCPEVFAHFVVGSVVPGAGSSGGAAARRLNP